MSWKKINSNDNFDWKNFDLDEIQERIWTLITNNSKSDKETSYESDLKYIEKVLNSEHTLAEELSCKRIKEEILKKIGEKTVNADQHLYDQFEKLYLEYKQGNEKSGYEYFQLLRSVFGDQIIFKNEPISKKETAKSSKKNSNSSIKKFTEILDAFICDSNITIPDTLLLEIRKYFNSVNLPDDEEIRKMNLNNDDTRGNTSRQLIKEALLKTKNSTYYPHINKLGIMMWNWKRSEMKKYRERILEEYMIFQNIYEEKISLGELEKVSNCNRGIRLYYHASRIMGHEFTYQKEDFLVSNSSKTVQNILGIFAKLQDEARLRGLIDD